MKPLLRPRRVATLGALALLAVARSGGATTTPVFATAATFATGTQPWLVATGDFNGDGKLDVAVPNLHDNTVSVFLGDGSGGFAAARTFSTAANPGAVAVADFNGDGKPDLAVDEAGATQVSIYLGDGSGGFTQSASSIQATSAQDVYNPGLAVGDFNGDGHPDVAVANGGGATGSVSVFLGDGAGGLGARTSFSTGYHPQLLAVGDLNRDGHPDLAVATDDGVSVLLGDGSGSFASAVTYAAGTSPGDVAIGDLNEDGKPDLVVSNYGSGDVSVLLGNGDGTFQAQSSYSAGSNAESVALADVDGDGHLDVVTANSGDADVSVLEGDGTGQLGPPTSFAVGSVTATPISVATADLNGDGKPDLLAVDSTNNVLAASLNTTAVTRSSLTVTRTDDPTGAGNCPTDCSLRQAIAAVATGGTITLPAGAYVLGQGQLLLDREVTIAGAGASTTSISQLSPSGYGRVLEVDTAGATISDVTIEHGNTDVGDGEPNAGAGGGIWVTSNGILTLERTTVSGNSASTSGGGVQNEGSLTVDRSQIVSNVASGSSSEAGGGIENQGDPLTVTNTTIADNHAAIVGGGIDDPGGTATLTNVTLSRNLAGYQGGGGIYGGGSHLVNTLLDSNTLASGRDGNCGGTLISNGHNLSTDTTCAASLTAAGDLNGVPASQAVDAGADGADCPSVDQNGTSRPQGPHCDIGAIETVEAANAAPTASFSASASGLAVSVDGSGSSDSDGTISSYAWSFGDGGTGTGATASHTYSAAGTYTVTLTVTDNGGATATATHNVTVAAGGGGGSAAPPPAPAPAPAPPGRPPVVVRPAPLTASIVVVPQRPVVNRPASFTAVVSDAGGPVRVHWQFGDGAAADGARPAHTYLHVGSYTVVASVVDAVGKKATATLGVTVLDQPGASFVYLPDTVVAGVAESFRAVAVSKPGPAAGTRIARWRWSFGDGGTAGGPAPRHVFAAAGSYTVTVTVVDAAGATGSATRVVDVLPAEVVVSTGDTIGVGDSALTPVSIGAGDTVGVGDGALVPVSVGAGDAVGVGDGALTPVSVAVGDTVGIGSALQKPKHTTKPAPALPRRKR